MMKNLLRLSLLVLLLACGVKADHWGALLGFPPDPPEEEGGKPKRHYYQGMDVYGDTMVSLQDGGYATVYRLGAGSFEKISAFMLASAQKYNHANVASFGIEKAQEGDPLPVLYVSQCHKKPVAEGKDVCFVERLAPDLQSSEIVQIIKYDDVNGDYGYALQWVVDLKEKMLYGYGNTVNNSDPSNRHRIVKFHLPKLSDGPVVVLKPEDALENYTIEEVSSFKFNPIGQGLYIYKGKLYMPTGIGTEKHPSILYVWDLKKRSMKEIDLSGCTTGELEDIALYGNRFLIQGQDGLFSVKI